jgi:hypothetical protein
MKLSSNLLLSQKLFMVQTVGTGHSVAYISHYDEQLLCETFLDVITI